VFAVVFDAEVLTAASPAARPLLADTYDSPACVAVGKPTALAFVKLPHVAIRRSVPFQPVLFVLAISAMEETLLPAIC
jgi:hypothetical protein